MPLGDVWGNSWGDSWNAHWKQSVTPPVQADDNFGGFGYRPSGGFPYQDQRSAEDIRRARQKFGVIPPDAEAAIAEVAIRQAARLEADQQKQFDELAGELKLRGLEQKAEYFQALAFERERLLNEEIAQRLRLIQQNEQVVLMLLIAAASTL